jgi:hypothetical protein
MTEKTTEKKERHIEVVKDPSFRTINVNHVYGGIRPGYLEMLVLSDEIDPIEGLKSDTTATAITPIIRRVQCRLIVDLIEAKRLLNWLTRRVSEYESKYGKILLPEEILKQSIKLEEKQPVEEQARPKLKPKSD